MGSFGLNQKKRKGLSLASQILIGLVLGVVIGLFFGDKAGALAIVGRGDALLYPGSWSDWCTTGGTVATAE